MSDRELDARTAKALEHINAVGGYLLSGNPVGECEWGDEPQNYSASDLSGIGPVLLALMTIHGFAIKRIKDAEPLICVSAGAYEWVRRADDKVEVARMLCLALCEAKGV